jgi:thiamine kinase-like enzyme
VVGNLVAGSLRGGPRKLYLIDFEYSAPGDRCFDLANLCVNAELDGDATCRVVRRYLGHGGASSAGVPPAPTEAAQFNELLARVELLKVT